MWGAWALIGGDGYENIKVDHIDYIDEQFARVFLTWEIPFRLGDKITNLHGAKGTVGLILPDNKMPYLTKKVGNMEPGPLEIIISGFSTIRRGSLGQLFEAWALACDIDLSDTDTGFRLRLSFAISNVINQRRTWSEKNLTA